MIKYRAYRDNIIPIEIISETEKTVTYMETFFSGASRKTREYKRSEYYSWHDSWDDAHVYLMELAEERVKSARLALERANGYLGNIKGMKKP